MRCSAFAAMVHPFSRNLRCDGHLIRATVLAILGYSIHAPIHGDYVRYTPVLKSPLSYGDRFM